MSQTAPHVEDRLLDFAYGELPEPEQREVQAHLHDCDECRASLEDIQGVRRVMSAVEPTPAPTAGLESLLAYAEQAARRAQAGPPPRSTWWRRMMVPVTGVAAAVVVGVVAQEVLEEGGDAASRREAVAEASMEAAPDGFKYLGGPVAAVPAPDELSDAREEPGIGNFAADPAAERDARERLVVVHAPARQDAPAGPMMMPKPARRAEAPPPPAEPPAQKAKELPALATKDARDESPKPGGALAGAAGEDLGGFGGLGRGDSSVGSGYGAKGGSLGDSAGPRGVTGRGYAETPAAPQPAPSSAPVATARESAAAKPADLSLAEARIAYDDEARRQRAEAEPTPKKKSLAKVAAPEPAEEEAQAVAQTQGKAEKKAEDKSALARELSDEAKEAYRESDREREARLLRQALPHAGADRPLLSSILVRLCSAEYALGRTAEGDYACDRVIREFRGTGVASLAASQKKEHRASLQGANVDSLDGDTASAGDSPGTGSGASRSKMSAPAKAPASRPAPATEVIK